jgi:signal transduction histidine kinase
MLETARLEHDTFDLYRDTFDLTDVVQEQLDVARPLSSNHRFTLASNGEPMLVQGDRARIGTIVSNLLDNAVKYSPDGGEVCCTVRSLGSHVCLSVRDEGMGIAPEHIATLFTRFGRLPTETNVTIPGTGLGLFLCREIATRHGGEVTVKSKPGLGTEFTLTLPAAR